MECYSSMYNVNYMVGEEKQDLNSVEVSTIRHKSLIFEISVWVDACFLMHLALFFLDFIDLLSFACILLVNRLYKSCIIEASHFSNKNKIVIQKKHGC